MLRGCPLSPRPAPRQKAHDRSHIRHWHPTMSLSLRPARQLRLHSKRSIDGQYVGFHPKARCPKLVSHCLLKSTPNYSTGLTRVQRTLRKTSSEHRGLDSIARGPHPLSAVCWQHTRDERYTMRMNAPSTTAMEPLVLLVPRQSQHASRSPGFDRQSSDSAPCWVCSPHLWVELTFSLSKVPSR